MSSGEEQNTPHVELHDPPSDATVRTVMSRLSEAQWHAIADALDVLPDLNYLPGRPRKGQYRARSLVWARNARDLARFTAVFERGVGRIVTGTDESLAVGSSLEETQKYLTDVTTRFGRGPAEIALLGLIAQRGKSSETAQSAEQLRTAIMNTTEKVQHADRVETAPEIAAEAEPTRVSDESDGASVDRSMEPLDDGYQIHKIVEQADSAANDEAPTDIRHRLTSLENSQKELLEFLLPHVADEVQSGERTDGAGATALTSWDLSVRDLIRDVTDLLGGFEPHSLEGIRTALDAWEAAEKAASKERENQFEHLSKQARELEAMLAEATPALRPHLQSALEEALRELANHQGLRLPNTQGEDVDAVEEMRNTADALGPGNSADAPVVSPGVEQTIEELGPFESLAGQLRGPSSESMTQAESDEESTSPSLGTPQDLAPDANSVGSDPGDTTSDATTTLAIEDKPDPQVERLAVELMRKGRAAEAYWVARLGGMSRGQVEALRYAAAGFVVGQAGLSSVDLYGLSDEVTEELIVADDETASTVVVAAMARALLADTFYPLCDTLNELLGEASLDSAWHKAFSTVDHVARTGYRHTANRRSDDHAEQLDKVRLDAHRLSESLKNKVIGLHRATLVVQHLSRPEGPWGQALLLAGSLEEGDSEGLTRLTRMGEELRDNRRIDELIDRTDAGLHPNRPHRDRIIAHARRQLKRVADEVGEVVGRAIALLEIGKSGEVTQQHARARSDLVRAFDSLPEPCTQGLAAASLLALRDWVLDPIRSASTGDLNGLLRSTSLQVVDVVRDEQDNIETDAEVAPEVLVQAFGEPLGPPDLAQRYIDGGNLALAEEILSTAGMSTDALDAHELRLSKLHYDRVEQARSRFDSFRANNLLDVGSEAELLAQLEQLAGDQERRYDLASRKLAAFLQRLEAEIAAAKESACSRLRALTRVSPSEAERVEKLIEASELSTAEEFLAVLESGQSLPEDGGSGSDLLAEFMAILPDIDFADSASSIAGLFGGIDQQVDRAAKGLEAWSNLSARQAWGSSRNALSWVRSVMGLTGMDATDDPHDVTPRGMGRSGYRTLRVAARPTDRSVIPALGSRCGGHYLLTVFRETRPTAGLLLDAIEESNQQAANIIWYNGVVPPEMRRDFLMESRKRKVSALLVDNAVIGFLAARTPGSFAGLQSVTLPFSGYDHWTPDVAGQVPDEVFVGRREELSEILNPAGSLFVYGGRQLGKSALLRKAERQFNAAPGNAAIYLDLKALGIGEYHEPDHLWTLVADELRKLGVITTQVSSPQSIRGKIEAWLDEDRNRRMLLLLDESDLFLEAESKPQREGGKEYRFRNVGLLKSLMEDTDRRFKPVFSGLHQVQRFHDISNTPLAHGGRDILVGPLTTAEAQELVQTPFEALGYRFASPDVMWGLLSFTNYQANLIQIACHALLGHMRNRRPKGDEPPTVIGADDVRFIVNSREVRDRIAEKFNLTVRLEDRYKVIALTLAVNTLGDRFGRTYDTAGLLFDCAVWWPQGFKGMKRREFDRYLDEMVGLGVLVRHDTLGRPVTFRSPNVVPMLGTKEEIEAELQDGAETFDLPHDYNPRATRRWMGDGSHSPLTEDELGHLLPVNPHEVPGTFVVVGSEACGIDGVSAILESVADDRGAVVEAVTAGGWRDFQTRTARQKSKRPIPMVLVRDDSPENAELCAQVAHHAGTTRTRALLILWPAAIGLLKSPEMADADLLSLSGWSDEGLRSWENPFNTRPQRPELLDHTNGWPPLVREAMKRKGDGQSTDAVLKAMRDFPPDPSSASHFLQSVGVLSRHRELISRWVEYTSDEDVVTLKDLQAILEPGSPEDIDVPLDELLQLGIVDQTEDGFRMDPVVWRCQLKLNSD